MGWLSLRAFPLSMSGSVTSTDLSGEIESAAILHLDIVQSTRLVRENLASAHHQILRLFCWARDLCELHHGATREMRGDAVVVHFAEVSDAISAALAIQCVIRRLNGSRFGNLNPWIRTGISYGPVVLGSQMVTGEPVIRAQRLEQLSRPGEVLFDHAAYEHLTNKSSFSIQDKGDQKLKGFNEPFRIYAAECASSYPFRDLAAHFNTVTSCSLSFNAV